jgi:hypothetical protein
LNPGLRGGKPATNRLSYGAAIEGVTQIVYMYNLSFRQLRTLVDVTVGSVSMFFESLGTGKHFQGALGESDPVFMSRRIKCFVFSCGNITAVPVKDTSDDGSREYPWRLHTVRLSVHFNVIPRLTFLFLASKSKMISLYQVIQIFNTKYSGQAQGKVIE